MGLQELDDAGCPTCGQDIDLTFIQQELHKHQTARTAYSEKLDEANDKLADINDANKMLKQMEQKINTWEEIYRSIHQTLPLEVPDSEEIQDKIIKLKERILNR